MAMTIGEAMLTGERQHIIDMTAYGRYLIGETWYNAAIDDAAIQAGGAVYISFYAAPQGADGMTITKLQLCNSSNAMLAEREETLTFTSAQERILIRFKFGLIVQTEAEA